MAISDRVQSGFRDHSKRMIRLSHRVNANANGWSEEEHERFLEGIEMYPRGPWKKIAEYVGTRTPRQTMTHAQKYRQRIARRRGRGRGQQVSTTEKTVQSSPSTPTSVSSPPYTTMTAAAMETSVSPEMFELLPLPISWEQVYHIPAVNEVPLIETHVGNSSDEEYPQHTPESAYDMISGYGDYLESVLEMLPRSEEGILVGRATDRSMSM